MDLQKQNSPKRHMSIIWLMIVLLIAAFAASIIISGIMFSRATRENREKIICKTAKLVAGQVDGYRTAASQSIPVEDGMQITFHAMSLPTA